MQIYSLFFARPVGCSARLPLRVALGLALCTVGGAATASAQQPHTPPQLHHALAHTDTVTVVHFWRADCSDCYHEFGLLRAAAQRFADRPVALLGVGMDPDPETWDAVRERLRLEWPQVWAPEFRADPRLVTQFPFTKLPAVYITHHGQAKEVKRMLKLGKQLRKALKTLRK